MSKLDKYFVEALLFKDKTPPTKKTKAKTLAQMLKEQREEERELEEYLEWRKAREDKKKPKNDDKDKLTFWQKVVLMHVGALAYVATLALLFRLTFH